MKRKTKPIFRMKDMVTKKQQQGWIEQQKE
jgi:hypothetical protein